MGHPVVAFVHQINFFLIFFIDEPTIMSHTGKEKTGEQTTDPTFKRKLSKREKKELKKAEKAAKAADAKNKVNVDKENSGEGVADKLYTGRTLVFRRRVA